MALGSVEIEQGNTLDEQMLVDERRQKLQKQIQALEKQAGAEKQPKLKFELVRQIKILKKNWRYNRDFKSN